MQTEKVTKKAKAQLQYEVESVSLAELKSHPRNYKKHPEEQLEHLAASLKQHGFYKNIVIARENTILAGHGIAEAAKKVGFTNVPVRRVPLDPLHPLALKILAADNELPKFAETDDRMLTEILREIRAQEDMGGLLGTGYDDQQLAALAMVTRPASEIADIDEAREWVGMPEYEAGEPQIKLVLTFKSEKLRKKFVDDHKMKVDKIAGLTWSSRWPPTANEDTSSLRFKGRKKGG